MSRFLPGNNANPKGRPKTAYKENFDQLLAKKKMFDQASQIMSERWEDVFHAMVDQAIKGNVQAANFIAAYTLGKPKEMVEHSLSEDSKNAISINISKEDMSL